MTRRALQVIRYRLVGAVAAWLVALALPAWAEAGHAEWVDRDWLHSRLDAASKRATTPAATHTLGHGIEVEHLALGTTAQKRLDHPGLMRPLQDDPGASKEFEDTGRYQAMPLAPQPIGRMIGVSLQAETTTPTAIRLASLPRPAVKTELHRHSASGFLRAHAEDTAGVVRKVAVRGQGGSR